MFRENQQIGFYTLIRKLGKGGFGEVWLAERKSKFVTTKVAVKLPLDEQVDHEAIKQEAQLWEQASGHPNILPIIDADEYDGQIVIVSEYAPDGSLDQWLKAHGKMPVEKAVEMTIKILDGLEFLHSRNIIHRDLKPANILLQNDTPRLADFGISRALRTTASSQSSNVSGTFAYMPPEGFDGKRSIQTDVWSVGVNLYQFLTGSLPFPQKEPSALIAAIMMRDFEPLPPDVPNNLQTAIAKSLAKQPENRYATAGEMREDLRRILRGEAVSDFVQPDSRQTFPAEQVTQIRKSAPLSANNSQDENETVVRAAPLEKSDLTKQKRLKKLNNDLESISNLQTGESSKTPVGWKNLIVVLIIIILVGAAILFAIANGYEGNTNAKNYNSVSNPLVSNTNLSFNTQRATNKALEKTVEKSKNPLSMSNIVTNQAVNISSANNYSGGMRNDSTIMRNDSMMNRNTIIVDNNSGSELIKKVRAALRRQGLTDVRVNIDVDGHVVLRGYTPKGRMADAVQIASTVGEKPVRNELEER